jgi:hypothetical protein
VRIKIINSEPRTKMKKATNLGANNCVLSGVKLQEIKSLKAIRGAIKRN